MDRKLITIYLQDHHAGSTTGLELAKRAAQANEDTQFGPFLERVRDEIVEDRETLEAIMEALGVSVHRVKDTAAWAAEKAGRLKLNGSLVAYSPLSRMLELEGLTSGISGKLSLWLNLREISSGEPALSGFDFDGLIDRADAQLDGLTDERLKAARVAFA